MKVRESLSADKKLDNTPWKNAVNKSKNSPPVNPGEVDFKVSASVPKGEEDEWKAPKLFDSQLNPWDGSPIWTGSTISVIVYPSVYYVQGKLGLKLRMRKVKVSKLVTGKSGLSFEPDEPVEGGSEVGEQVAEEKNEGDSIPF